MRISIAVVVAILGWHVMTGVLAAADVTATSQQDGQQDKQTEGFQVGQRVVLDRTVKADVDDGEPIALRRGTVVTIVAIEGERAQVCDLAPVWLDLADLLCLRDARIKITNELKDNQQDVDLWVALGHVCRGQGIHDSAVESYCRALAMDEDDWDAVRGRADSYYHALRPGTCLRGLDRVLEHDAHDTWAHYLRGTVLLCHDRFAEAIVSLDIAIKNAPQFVMALVARAEAKWKSGDVDGAMVDYDEAIRVCENAASPYVGRAGYAMSQGDYESAATDLKKAIEINPRSHRAHYQLARVILAAGDEEIGTAEDAVDHAKLANRYTSGQVPVYAKTLSKAYQSYAVFCRQEGEPARAAEMLSRAAEWKIHAVRLAINRENYYRDWMLENAFRRGEPRDSQAAKGEQHEGGEG